MRPATQTPFGYLASHVGRLSIVLILAASGGTGFAQDLFPAKPRYLEPVHLRILGSRPYENLTDIQVSMEGTTIVVSVQSKICNDLCNSFFPWEVELGRFPTGTYSVRIVKGEHVSTVQFTVAPPNNPYLLLDYTGMWWLPSESGWGISIFRGPTNILFAVWFVYDEAGNPTWYTLQAQGGGPSYSGPIYRTKGPYFGGPFDPFKVEISVVGTGEMHFYTIDSASFSYVADGVRDVKYITRQLIE